MVVEMLLLPDDEETALVRIDMLLGGHCLTSQISFDCLLKNSRSSLSRVTCNNDLLRSALRREDYKSLPMCMVIQVALALEG